MSRVAGPVTATTVATAADTHFDRTLRLVEGADDGHFIADLDPSWASLRGVHGGYMTALAVRAAEAAVPDRVTRTISTSFLRPAAVGPADLRVEQLRAGRSLTTVVVALGQDGRIVTTTRVTMGVGHGYAEGREWAEPVADRPATRGACVGFTPPPSIRHFEQAELLIDPATIPAGDGSPARIAGHVRPKEGRAVDAAWLAMIGDWFPPSPFRRFEPPVGGVSLDYAVHLHQVPAGAEWLEGVFVAPNGADGIALERGTLALPNGALVAETFHTRWTG